MPETSCSSSLAAPRCCRRRELRAGASLIGSDHVQRGGQPALCAQAVQVAPDHQLAEQEVLRAGMFSHSRQPTRTRPATDASRGATPATTEETLPTRAATTRSRSGSRRRAPSRPAPPRPAGPTAPADVAAAAPAAARPTAPGHPGRRPGTPSGPGGSLSRRCQGSDWLWWKSEDPIAARRRGRRWVGSWAVSERPLALRPASRRVCPERLLCGHGFVLWGPALQQGPPRRGRSV